VRRHFEWIENTILAPRRVEVTDLEGNMLSQAVFDNYELNTGIADDEFLLMPREE
jgi:outer membrane lipoprotein-sorting protein